MNLTTLTALAAQFAGDPDQSRYTGKYTQAINFAQQQFALDAKCLWKDSSSAIVAGTATYSLPSDFMWEKMVTYSKTGGNSFNELIPISRHELIRNRGDDWTQVTGQPLNFIVDPEEARKQIRIFPYLPSGDAGGTMVMTYYPLPTDLSSGTDTPLNSYALLAQFHIGIGAWAAWFLLEAEQATSSIVEKKRELLQIYNDNISRATDTFKNTASELMRQRGTRNYGFSR